MSKQTQLIFGGAIILIIVLAIGAYFVFGNSSQNKTQTTDVATNAQRADESQSTTSSIKSLLSGNKNVMCTVKYPPDSGMNGEGTVYVSANKMRGDFIMMVNNQSTDSHMISDGEYMYSWSSQAAQGTKIKMETIDKQQTGQEKSNADINQQVDLNCSDWSVDDSKFTPPAEIKFTELNIPVNTTQNQSPGQAGGQNLSTVCDQITDPQAKAACMQQTGN